MAEERGMASDARRYPEHYVKRKALSKQMLYNKHYAYKFDIEEQMRNYQAPPKELLEKMKRSRKCIRPIILDEKQLSVVNRESYKRVMTHFNELKVIDEKSTELIKKMDEHNLREFENQQRARRHIRESIRSMEHSSVIRSLLTKREKEYRRLVAEGKNIPRSAVMEIVSEEDIHKFEGIGATAKENRRRRLVERMVRICSRIADEYRARMVILEEKKRKRKIRDNVASTKKYASLLEAVKALGYDQVEEEKDEWQELQSCRYLRGKEPKNMRMPEEGMLTNFVFGDHEIESDTE